MLKEQLAARTLAWSDVDKFIFLWDYELVVVHIDPTFESKRVVTNHTNEVLREIYIWLDSKPTLPANPFEFEGKYGAETDRY